MKAFLAVGCLVVAVAGCGESERCRELREQIQELIRTECPTGSSCGGNPTMDKPVVTFAMYHYDILQEMEGVGCSAPDLGEAPWFCNSGGVPECPAGYTCCLESLAPVCRRQCLAGDGGTAH
jgi:hypothetical protein